MRLKKVIIKNFRSYSEQTTINISDLTAFIGKNDAGKSTILEALEIFFNNKAVKMDKTDRCIHNSTDDIIIGCVFDDLPENIIIDTNSKTTLEREYLLNKDGDLEIHKKFSGATLRATIYAIAYHPTNSECNNLLHLKRSDLRNKISSLNIEDVNQNSNVQLRRAIWNSYQNNLELATVYIELNVEDGKKIWAQLEKELPIYSLFRSDRPSSDEDAEVQDPMKVAIQQALKTVENQIEIIENTIQQQVEDVAKRTLEKIHEIDPGLSNELGVHFKSDRKWESLFKLSLTGDDQIPINKRGSGVRRLILLNFFRAEAERKRINNAENQNVIYAIEEPETSQHPSSQKSIVQALSELSEAEGTQVLFTTHAPQLASIVSIDSVRYVENAQQIKQVSEFDILGNNNFLKTIAKDLGVNTYETEKLSNISLIIYVEGKFDVDFLHEMSELYNQHDQNILNLKTCTNVLIIPCGGSSLQEWIDKDYLSKLGNIPEFHLYDRDEIGTNKHENMSQLIQRINDAGNVGILTKKREIENYLPVELVRNHFGFSETFTYNDDDDVSKIVAHTFYLQNCAEQNEEPTKTWGGSKSFAKKRINQEIMPLLTLEHIEQHDMEGEIKGWLQVISNLAFQEMV